MRILDDDATIEDYARYLTAMLGFHAPVEELLAVDPALEAAGFAALTRRKSHLLARDLRCVAPSANATPRCSALPVSTSTSHRLGIAYVIEGSTLGGKFILAHLPSGLASLRGIATAFLAGYGVDTGARWRSFGAVVERIIVTADAEAEAVAGARETFARLIAWLARFEQPDARRATVTS